MIDFFFLNFSYIRLSTIEAIDLEFTVDHYIWNVIYFFCLMVIVVVQSKQIFKGHVIPNGLLDSRFIRMNMQHKFTFRSIYGIPFTFEKQSTGNALLLLENMLNSLCFQIWSFSSKPLLSVIVQCYMLYVWHHQMYFSKHNIWNIETSAYLRCMV